MSDKPISDAIAKFDIPHVPAETVTLGVEAKPHDVGVTVSANKDIGKPGGWAAGTAASWWKSTGLALKGWLTWSGK